MTKRRGRVSPTARKQLCFYAKASAMSMMEKWQLKMIREKSINRDRRTHPLPRGNSHEIETSVFIFVPLTHTKPMKIKCSRTIQLAVALYRSGTRSFWREGHYRVCEVFREFIRNKRGLMRVSNGGTNQNALGESNSMHS
jgi:hypothetical protein